MSDIKRRFFQDITILVVGLIAVNLLVAGLVYLPKEPVLSVNEFWLFNGVFLLVLSIYGFIRNAVSPPGKNR